MRTTLQERIPKSGNRFSDQMRDKSKHESYFAVQLDRKTALESLNTRFDRGFHPAAAMVGYLLLLAPVPLAVLKLVMGV